MCPTAVVTGCADQDDLPVAEGSFCDPRSPCGVTKRAGKHLCGLYAANGLVAAGEARGALGYEPRRSLREGVRDKLDWIGGTA